MSDSDVLTTVLNGNTDALITNIQNSEISSSKRDEMLTLLEDEMGSYTAGSAEYDKLATARAQILDTPLISSDRIDNANQYSDLNQKIGTFSQQLATTTLPNVNTMNLSDEDKSLYASMVSMKASVSSNTDLQCTPTNKLNNYDVSSLVPQITTTQKDYLSSLNLTSDSSRTLDLSPTTKAMITEWV